MEDKVLKFFVVVAIFVLFSNTALAIEDTAENRAKEAERYLAITPLKEQFEDYAKELAKNQPPEKREIFKSIFTKYMDINAIITVQKDALIKTFTADELAYLADTANSQMAKTVEKKMGKFMAEITPDIQAEAMKAIAKANRDIEDCDQKNENSQPSSLDKNSQ
jgi:uncharacterized protein YqeY